MGFKEIKWYFQELYRKHTHKPIEIWHPDTDLNVEHKKSIEKITIKKPDTNKELQSLEKMINNWKESYIKQIDPTGGNEYLISDFLEEIEQTYIVPYIGRLIKTEHITKKEANQWMGIYLSKVNELNTEIKKIEKNATRQ